jgi:hypothetical protein
VKVKELPKDCAKNFEAWELKLLKSVDELRRGRKPCTIIVRFDGLAWHVHDCLSPSDRIEMKS